MIKKVFIIDTVYTLFLSLLIDKSKNAESSYFFVGTTISNDILNKLPHIKQFNWHYFFKIKSLLNFCLLQPLKWPFLLYSHIYAQDHLYFSSCIIGFRKYSLIEDSPFIFAWANQSPLYNNIKHKNKFHNFIATLIKGPIYKKSFGQNKLCEEYIVTSKANKDSTFLKGKKILYYGLTELWLESSTNKKNFIKNVFDLTDDFIKNEKNYRCVLFTQPLNDYEFTDEEQLEYYRPYIEQYSHLGIALKIHPRDKVDYKKYYPFLHIIYNQAPMQLLSLCGINYKVAITGFSTAICGLSQNTEIIWIGTKNNSKLFNILGDLKIPQN